jgi:hypothetical protein
VGVAESVDDQLVADNPRCLCVKYLVLGMAKKQLQDEAAAQNAWLKAKAIAEDAARQTARILGAKWRLPPGLFNVFRINLRCLFADFSRIDDEFERIRVLILFH